MDFTSIILAVTIMAVLGLAIGLFLGIAGEKLKVEVDEKEVAIRECLPGNNCGGCGYAGCDGLAKAIATGEAPVTGCPVAGTESANKIAGILGVEAGVVEKKVAFVKCAGTCDKTIIKYNYFGINDCRKIELIPGGGPKGCDKGCLGFGSCMSVCSNDAIKIVDGVAQVDGELCSGCGQCVQVCPKNIIELVPYESKYRVSCSSTAKGKDVKAVCQAGCIGCTLCTKVCESGAITVENNLARIDYDKCTGCGKCVEKCPVKVIKLFKIV